LEYWDCDAVSPSRWCFSSFNIFNSTSAVLSDVVPEIYRLSGATFQISLLPPCILLHPRYQWLSLGSTSPAPWTFVVPVHPGLYTGPECSVNIKVIFELDKRKKELKKFLKA